MDAAIAGVVSSAVTAGAFTVMGLRFGHSIEKLQREFARERQTLINHIMSGTTGEFLARQRAVEAPSTPVTKRPETRGSHQIDLAG